jgi:hypothetical protein
MHVTRLKLLVSALASFNRSIVQGSGIGPILFIIFASDLQPIDLLNFIIKYADDCTLLCPERSNTTLEVEMAHVLEWAKINKLQINLTKTKEIVFKRPHFRLDLLPQPLANVERVTSAKLLGIQLRHDLSFDDHISSVVAVCNQRLYLLTQLKKQGLNMTARDIVFKSIIINKIMYAMPAIYGYLTAKNKRKLSSIFDKALRWDITGFNYDFEILTETAQITLFRHSKSESHSLNHLYTRKEPNINSMLLRPRGHCFLVPPMRSNFNSRDFVYRSVLNYL